MCHSNSFLIFESLCHLRVETHSSPLFVAVSFSRGNHAVYALQYWHLIHTHRCIAQHNGTHVGGDDKERLQKWEIESLVGNLSCFWFSWMNKQAARDFIRSRRDGQCPIWLLGCRASAGIYHLVTAAVLRFTSPHVAFILITSLYIFFLQTLSV